MALVLLTKSPKFNLKEFINNYKKIIKFFLGQKRGPDIVTDSLIKGLKELNYDFKCNVKEKAINHDDIVYVNNSIEALRWAIRMKQEGKLAKLVAGPVIVVLPEEQEEIICDSSIDKIIVPSQWVRDVWLSKKPSLVDRIIIWPAGVDNYNYSEQEKNIIILYQKNAPNNLCSQIQEKLMSNGENFKIIKYGYYKHKNYLNDLNRAKAVIFLSESESQGLAMCEAWMNNVPTLVWNRGYWCYKNNIWYDTNISAPYLNEKTGLFFKDFTDFVGKWDKFISNLSVYRSRDYAEENFSHKLSAENFLKQILL